MRLRDWIDNNYKSIRSFALDIGLKHRNIEMWCRGERKPNHREAEIIFEFTNNEVTGHDFYLEKIKHSKKEKKDK
jgi:hypothetical protein|tara:strand:+ start:196 stop:420 length:225 start_codon:yes stop_codon:yes gene_type:complete